MLIELERDSVEKIEGILSAFAISNSDRELIKIVKSIRNQLDNEDE